MKVGVRSSALSVAVFMFMLLGLTMLDPRVRDTLVDLFSPGNAVPLGNRFTDAGLAKWSSVRYESIENSPKLIFATVGTVLTVFMLRS
jgi:hypothetical protein